MKVIGANIQHLQFKNGFKYVSKVNIRLDSIKSSTYFLNLTSFDYVELNENKKRGMFLIKSCNLVLYLFTVSNLECFNTFLPKRRKMLNLPLLFTYCKPVFKDLLTGGMVAACTTFFSVHMVT